jgi:tetratricopeptide (TPR) repeat protein
VALAALALAALVAAPADAAEALAEGDAHYAQRATGAVGARARREEIEAAIAGHRRAFALDPASLKIRSHLIRSLFFRADFCDAGPDERKRIFEEARKIADEGLLPLETMAGRKTLERIPKLKGVPDAAEFYFWSAVAWGEWALIRGKLAAAREGAAGRVRDLGQTVIDLDPELEQGGGDRILGRLHDQSPKIPFLTGWVSRQEALAHLRRALELGPRNTVNQFFLAEAILDHDEAHKDEARRLLAQCAGATPRPEYQVEDTYYAELSRKRLAELH